MTRSLVGDPIECASDKCSTKFQRDTQNRSKKFCSRECSHYAVGLMTKGKTRKPHTEETRRLISQNTKGKNLGHPFWGDREKAAEGSRRRAKAYMEARPWVECLREGCENTFQKAPKNPKRYCSISCAQKTLSTLGTRSKGRTSAEGSGRCKWYTYHSHITDQYFRVQGTWELRYANCLDSLGSPWSTVHGTVRFTYTDLDGIERTYSPDFVVGTKYIEVKGYADPATEHKLKEMKQQGVELEVVYWKDLKSLEIRLFGRPLSSVNTHKRVVEELSCGQN